MLNSRIYRRTLQSIGSVLLAAGAGFALLASSVGEVAGQGPSACPYQGCWTTNCLRILSLLTGHPTKCVMFDQDCAGPLVPSVWIYTSTLGTGGISSGAGTADYWLQTCSEACTTNTSSDRMGSGCSPPSGSPTGSGYACAYCSP